MASIFSGDGEEYFLTLSGDKEIFAPACTENMDPVVPDRLPAVFVRPENENNVVVFLELFRQQSEIIIADSLVFDLDGQQTYRSFVMAVIKANLNNLMM